MVPRPTAETLPFPSVSSTPVCRHDEGFNEREDHFCDHHRIRIDEYRTQGPRVENLGTLFPERLSRGVNCDEYCDCTYLGFVLEYRIAMKTLRVVISKGERNEKRDPEK